MSRESELSQAIAQFRTLLRAERTPDVEEFIARHAHLLPELRAAVEQALIAQASPAASASTIDHAASLNPSYAATDTLRYVGEYRLERLLGRGAFGEVWEATQLSLNRAVAVKLLLGQHDTPDLVRRFRREAEVLAQVQHPHIVNVLEVNSDQGRHYIAMELVRGENLKQRLERGLPDFRWAAEQMQRLAEAIAHAHEAGVVHRDLKPANLLWSDSQELKVTDFGLAKRVASETELTVDGAVLGTLAYMPPEQALGKVKEVGPAADIYAIGATLYHLLTGRPPFPTKPDLPPAAIFDEIRDVDPIPPSRLQGERSLPRDLETICVTCLAKDPQRRYASARALADDLARYLAGDPIAARPVSWAERAWMRVKKRPVISSLAAAVVVAFIAAAGFALQGWRLAQDVTSARGSLASQTQALEQTQSAKSAAEEREQAARDHARRETEQRALQEYLADMAVAQDLWKQGELGRLRDVLAIYESPADFDPRGFEWYFLRQQLAAPAPLEFASKDAPWNRLAFDSRGERLASLDRDGNLVVWALPTGEEAFRALGPAHSFEFAASGEYCVVLRSAEEGTFRVLSAATGELVREFRAGPFTTCFALHPKENKILMGDNAGGIYLRELPSGKIVKEVSASHNDRALMRRSLDIEHGTLLELAFHPTGAAFAAGWEDGTTQFWHVESGTIHRQVDIAHHGPVTGLAFSPQGNLLASQSAGRFDQRQEVYVPGDVRVVVLATGGKLSQLVPHPAKLDEPAVLATEHGLIPYGMFRPAFSADGEQLYTTGSRAATRWHARTGQREEEYPGHDGLVYAVALSPDGSQLAAAGHDGVIRVWPSAGNTPYAVLATALGGIRSLVLSPDERHFAALCDRGIELRVPDLRTGLLSPPRALTDTTLRIWNAATGEQRYEQEADCLTSPVQFLPGRQELWSCGQRFLLHGDNVEVRAPAEKRPYGTVELAGPGDAFILRYSPYEPDIELWRGTQTEPYARFEGLAQNLTAVAISHAGDVIAIGEKSGRICLWASASGELLHECRAHVDEITTLAFRPDDAVLLSGGQDRKLLAWDVRTGEKLRAFPGHRREISGIAFTKSGERFVSSSGALRVAQTEQGSAGEVRLWDFASGRLCIELTTDREIYSGVAISADGRRIFAAANTHTNPAPGRIVVWDGTAEAAESALPPSTSREHSR